MNLPESLIQFAWKYRLYDQRKLKLCTGEQLSVLAPGWHNRDSGPDFLNARLKIGDTLWAGNVEVHIRSSDWFRHNHEDDPAYRNIILHVVLEHDVPVHDLNGAEVKVLELKNRVSDSLMKQWQTLASERQIIPCATQLNRYLDLFPLWFGRLTIERIEEKTERINRILSFTRSNWQEAFYICLARSFGFNVNATPFELLASSIPFQTILSYKHSLLKIESLLFGQSGLLDFSGQSPYEQSLIREYTFLAAKHTLKPLQGHIWKFLRMRPNNFPLIRISQFAALLERINDLFEVMNGSYSIRDLQKLFDVCASPYWTAHYNFGKPGNYSEKRLGALSIDTIIINTLVPFLFVYGKARGDDKLQNRALEYLSNLAPESNSVVNVWKSLGLQPKSAADTQAMLQLRNQYCECQRCSDCTIGHAILREQVQA